MFFSEVEGRMQKLSSFGQGKKFGLKSHLRGPSTQPFNYRQGFVITHFACAPCTLSVFSAIIARDYCFQSRTRFIVPGITLHCLTDHASFCLACPVKQKNSLMRQNLGTL